MNTGLLCRCRKLVPAGLAILAAGFLASCRTAHFYAQAAAGQWEIVRKARPIPELMGECFGESTKVKERLALVQELRAFASRELGLPAEKQYDRYTDLGRPYVVWVVFAAPEFSTEAKTWSYPLLGKLKYRGWFNEADAQREAEDLKRAGYDVTVGGTEAYSTLGWLRDPVLNTFLHRSDADLAELIFHELTHQALFLKGDTDFNEALATAVGESGARQWLRSKHRTRDLSVYEKQLRLKHRIIAEVLRTKSALSRLYTDHAGESPEWLRREKTAHFSALRDKAGRLRAAAGVVLPRPPPLMNNAGLNSVAAYYTLVPALERKLREAGSVPAFLSRMKTLKALSPEERRAWLDGPATDSR